MNKLIIFISLTLLVSNGKAALICNVQKPEELPYRKNCDSGNACMTVLITITPLATPDGPRRFEYLRDCAGQSLADDFNFSQPVQNSRASRDENGNLILKHQQGCFCTQSLCNSEMDKNKLGCFLSEPDFTHRCFVGSRTINIPPEEISESYYFKSIDLPPEAKMVPATSAQYCIIEVEATLMPGGSCELVIVHSTRSYSYPLADNEIKRCCQLDLCNQTPLSNLFVSLRSCMKESFNVLPSPATHISKPSVLKAPDNFNQSVEINSKQPILNWGLIAAVAIGSALLIGSIIALKCCYDDWKVQKFAENQSNRNYHPNLTKNPSNASLMPPFSSSDNTHVNEANVAIGNGSS